MTNKTKFISLFKKGEFMKITWIGTNNDVKGNIEFITDRGQNVTLTAEDIKALYEVSIKQIHNN